jgi:DNA mismatch endonuclease, patch repair protein
VGDYPAASSPGRAANMRAIRRTNTKPELALRSALHRQGYRFRKDYRLDLDAGARVRPDIAFTARRVAVFVDGCFWHACPEHGRNPEVNEWYWAPKLRRTVERDRAADAALTAAGWRVVRIWEHVPLTEAIAAVTAALHGDPSSGILTNRTIDVRATGSARWQTQITGSGIAGVSRTRFLKIYARLPARNAARTGRPAAQGGNRPRAAACLRGDTVAARVVCQR